MKIRELVNFFEQIAPTSLQENYDNSGLLVGNEEEHINGVLVNLNCTEDVLEEAIENNCNVIVSHHPIWFQALKRLTGKNHVERIIMKAIKNNIALYSIHTNLDNVLHQGVNESLGKILGLKNVQVLVPKENLMKKLVVFVPSSHAKNVVEALGTAGAGKLGNYDNCSFQTEGEGQFRPLQNSNAFIGVIGSVEKIKEQRVEVIYENYRENKIIEALNQSHPYEEVAYDIYHLDRQHQQIGAGAFGDLQNTMNEQEFLSHLKEKLNLEIIRFTPREKSIKKVAICGGAGSFLLGAAKRIKADALVTGDFKYHEFFMAENDITICDIGHHESENHISSLLYDIMKENFINFAVILSKVNTNPVKIYK